MWTFVAFLVFAFAFLDALPDAAPDAAPEQTAPAPIKAISKPPAPDAPPPLGRSLRSKWLRGSARLRGEPR